MSALAAHELGQVTASILLRHGQGKGVDNAFKEHLWLSWLGNLPAKAKGRQLYWRPGTHFMCLGCRFSPHLGHVQETTQ